MVGGILSERTVKEVLPSLQHNKTQVSIVESLVCKKIWKNHDIEVGYLPYLF